ncbi:hypothetical protein M3Y98_01034000 [Aphelenchoides besseyi]|nr:hypothetical protein M3Y98_01034000 [Aphelenchoides besseyi]KAI6209941.1 hypothetical protein M3Y96_00274400 [Aphelenchoides besseyi]
MKSKANASKVMSGNAMGTDSCSSEQIYDLIIRSQSRSRIDDQRSELGSAAQRPSSCSDLPLELPDEVADIVLTMQSTRYENQRAYLKPPCASDSDLLSVGNGNDSPQRCASATPHLSVHDA